MPGQIDIDYSIITASKGKWQLWLSLRVFEEYFQKIYHITVFVYMHMEVRRGCQKKYITVYMYMHVEVGEGVRSAVPAVTGTVNQPSCGRWELNMALCDSSQCS